VPRTPNSRQDSDQIRSSWYRRYDRHHHYHHVLKVWFMSRDHLAGLVSLTSLGRSVWGYG
jgi:hypothetical protein